MSANLIYYPNNTTSATLANDFTESNAGSYDVSSRSAAKRRVGVFAWADGLLISAIVFAGIAFVSYLMFGLVANVCSESARQNFLHDSQRTEVANQSLGDLNRSIEKLGSTSSIETWASENNFYQVLAVKSDSQNQAHSSGLNPSSPL